MSLQDIVTKVTAELPNIDFDPLIEGQKFPEHLVRYMKFTPYYKALAAYIKLYDIKNVLELGTCTGLSALGMSLYAESVTTCDITAEPYLLNEEIEKKRNIKPLIIEDCLDYINDDYDMIFVDIDHSGKMEPFIHQRIQEKFKGIVFYDDIFMNDEMSKFWANIKEEKIHTFWHRCGFGLVRH